MTKEELLDWLRPVEDPELFISIVDLGLIYEACIKAEGKVYIKMTLTSPGCPMGEYIVSSLKDRALEHKDIKEAEVELVWEPKWDPETMASEDAKDQMGLW